MPKQTMHRGPDAFAGNQTPGRGRRAHLPAIFALAIMPTLAAPLTADVTVTRLRCEYAVNPLGIDVVRPRLSWVLESPGRGQVQTAYQIVVAVRDEALSKARDVRQSRPDGSADSGTPSPRSDDLLWDTGKVVSKQSVGVEYAGLPLRSGQRVWWAVRVWDKDGRPSAFSEPAWWEMALLRPADWHGRWICRDEPAPKSDEELYADHPAPLFRREFTCGKSVARARAYVSGLGYYELRLNGQRVGDHALDPGWTTYSRRVLYSTYDVTTLLQRGPNAVGVIVGNGWYNPLPLRMWGHLNLREHLTIGRPRFILQLDIEYADGTRKSVCSNEDWKAGDSPILRNSVYLGEVYDARREQPGWDRPGFDDRGWRPAIAATEPVGPLRAQAAETIKVTRTIEPVRFAEPKPGVHIFDMGQNFAGWVRLRANAPPGTRIMLRYGELLHPDGTLNGMTSVCGQIKKAGSGGPGAPPIAYQCDTYICKGDSSEIWEPRFTFRGFRYVEVTGLPNKPPLDLLEGLRLNSAVEEVGTFACSNEMFNRIHEMVRWTQLSNLFSVQSDCPHREKFGYGGDIVASSEAAMLNLDMSRFYAKAVQDLADAARPNGGMTETAPFVGIADEGLGGQAGPIGWGTAFPLLQWQLYRYYGNRRPLEESYEATKRWIALLESKAVEGILDNGISDHESLVPKPRALTGTAFYHLNARTVGQIARTLGHTDDAARFDALANGIADAFNRRFLRPGTGRYDTGTQACQAFALHMGLVPPKARAAATEVLVKDIMEMHKGHLTTGIFGTKYMLDALTSAGRADVAYTIVNQKTFPGWGHMIEKGATTLWEHWEFSDNTFSHNHPMFGSVSEWLIKSIAGISPADDVVGFDRVIIRPRICDGLTWAKARYESIRGAITTEWKLDGNALTLDVTIPVNATAEVHVPLAAVGLRGRAPQAAPPAVLESGKPADKAEGVRPLRADAEAAVFSIGSGTYRFAVHEFVGG